MHRLHVCTCRHACTRSCAHTHRHACTDTHVHEHRRTSRHMHAHTHTPTLCVHRDTCAHRYGCSHTRARARTRSSPAAAPSALHWPRLPRGPPYVSITDPGFSLSGWVAWLGHVPASVGCRREGQGQWLRARVDLTAGGRKPKTGPASLLPAPGPRLAGRGQPCPLPPCRWPPQSPASSHRPT